MPDGNRLRCRRILCRRRRRLGLHDSRTLLRTWHFQAPIFPPSVNALWRAFVRGKRVCNILTADGRAFRESMGEFIALARREGTLPEAPISGKLIVRLDLYQPNRIRRDVDNYSKSVLDAMTHASVWLDDSQVDVLLAVKHPPQAGRMGFRLTIRER